MLDKYLSLVTSEHYGQPRFTAWLTAQLSKVGATKDLLQNLSDHFDLDRAVGQQLDVLGQLVGVKRLLTFQPEHGPSLMDDATYRIALRAKIVRNQWDGSNEGLERIWQAMFPDDVLIFFDNQNMSMSFLIPTFNDPYLGELIRHGYILPRPMGVELDYSISQLPFFGFSRDGETYPPGIVGFGVGTWVKVEK